MSERREPTRDDIRAMQRQLAEAKRKVSGPLWKRVLRGAHTAYRELATGAVWAAAVAGVGRYNGRW